MKHLFSRALLFTLWACAAILARTLALPGPALAQKLDPGAVYEVTLQGSEPQKGPSDAPVTIVEFGGFQDPFSARALITIDEVTEQYGAHVRIVWLNFPLPFQKQAKVAANAALEAYAQKGNSGFWAMHDKLLANQSALTRADLEGYADELGLDLARFKTALDSGKHDSLIERDQELGSNLGVRGTPTFFVNGRPVSGARPFSAFRPLIDEELTRAGVPLKKGTTKSQVTAEEIARVDAASTSTVPPRSAPSQTSPLPSYVDPEVAIKAARAKPQNYQALPSIEQVLQENRRNDAEETAARQIAAFQVLQNYIELATERSRFSVDEMPPAAASKWNEYKEGARQVRERVRNQKLHAVNSVAVFRYFNSDEFRKKVIGRLSVESQELYWAVRGVDKFANDPFEGAPLDERQKQLIASLPSVPQVLRANQGANPRDTASRQVASLWVLMDYMDRALGDELSAQPQYVKYNVAQKSLAADFGVGQEFKQYYDSPEFRDGVLLRLPWQYRVVYWGLSPLGWTTRNAPPVESLGRAPAPTPVRPKCVAQQPDWALRSFHYVEVEAIADDGSVFLKSSPGFQAAMADEIYDQGRGRIHEKENRHYILRRCARDGRNWDIELAGASATHQVAIVTDSRGEAYYAHGSTSPNEGEWSLKLSKLTSAGKTIWTSAVESIGTDPIPAIWVGPGPHPPIYVATTLRGGVGPKSLRPDEIAARYNASGRRRWLHLERRPPPPPDSERRTNGLGMREPPPPSHLDFSWLPYLAADDEGHVYVLGPAAHGSLSMKAGHGALAKLNPDGQIDWRLDVLLTAPTMEAIAVSPNGESIYLVGNPSGTSKVVIQKVDARGRQQWLRQFDGPWTVVPFVDEHAVASAQRMRVRRRLVAADDNTVYVALDTAPTFLVAFDGHNGDLKWVQQYGILPFPYAAPTHLRLMSNGEIGIGLMMREEQRRVHGMFRIQRSGNPVP